jgi:hypothetical protein
MILILVTENAQTATWASPALDNIHVEGSRPLKEVHIVGVSSYQNRSRCGGDEMKRASSHSFSVSVHSAM